MTFKTGGLWHSLQQAGLVQGNQPGADETPWYIKVLLGFSGWLAALFLLAFIGTGFAFVIENRFIAMIVGCLLIGAAYFLLRVPRNEFYEHLALAVSLVGQALVVWVVLEGVDNSFGWFVLAVLQAGLAVIMPNFIHRVFSSFFAAFSLAAALAAVGAPYMASNIILFAAAWLWVHEFSHTGNMGRTRAIAYGLVLGLVQIKGVALFSIHNLGWHGAASSGDLWVKPWMGELLAGIVMIYVVWHILDRLGYRLSDAVSVVVLAGSAVMTIASMEARGITTGLLIILLGFYGSNRVLQGLGILSLLFFISSYYYLLDVTLLDKSITLLISGLVLLAVRWLFLRTAINGRAG